MKKEGLKGTHGPLALQQEGDKQLKKILSKEQMEEWEKIRAE